MTRLQLRDDGLKWREIDGELVAVDIVTSTYVTANATGMALWQALAQGATRETLVDELVDAFGIDRERAAADVDAFLDDLRRKDLLAA